MQIYAKLVHCTCKLCKEEKILQVPGLHGVPSKQDFNIELWYFLLWPIISFMVRKKNPK